MTTFLCNTNNDPPPFFFFLVFVIQASVLSIGDITLKDKRQLRVDLEISYSRVQVRSDMPSAISHNDTLSASV